MADSFSKKLEAMSGGELASEVKRLSGGGNPGALRAFQGEIARRSGAGIGGSDPAAAAKLQAQTSREGRISSALSAGKAKGEEFIPTGSLGRIKEEVGRLKEGQFETGPSADVQEILKRRRAALEGFSGKETEERRAKGVEEIGRASEQQRRRLQAIQARTGVRGGTAAAQQAQGLQQALKGRADFERDLFLANEQAKRDALSSYEGSVLASERSEFEKKSANVSLSQFNLQQAAQERFGQISTSLGFAQLVEGDVASQRAAEAAKAAAAASAGCFHPDTPIKMADGGDKLVRDISIGDKTAGGIVYSLLATMAPVGDMFTYNGVLVTGCHAVKENKVWMRVRDSKYAVLSNYEGILMDLK
jgi:hypothetical protein